MTLEIRQRELFGTVVVEQGIGARSQPFSILSRAQIHAVVVHDKPHDFDVFPNRPSETVRARLPLHSPPSAFATPMLERPRPVSFFG